jgi:hypothetical protein
MNELLMLWMLAFAVTPGGAQAQVHGGFGGQTVSIAISLSSYPALVRVPGYPVYYASRLDSNYFFYDGMYWVYSRDNWYASTWYNGPWYLVAPEDVPLYVLRIPVRYYRQPPPYFSGWLANSPPRWGDHWGNEWSQRNSGWDRWNRKAAPAPAPLPVYQRQYAGDRYPRVEQQQALHSQNYRYQPRDPVVRRQPETPRGPSAPPPSQRSGQGAPVVVPRTAAPQDGQRNVDRPAPGQTPPDRQGNKDQAQVQPPRQRATQRLPPKAADDVQKAVPVKPASPAPRRERPPAQQKAEPPRPEAQPRQPEAKVQSQEAAPQSREAPPRSEQGQGQGPGKDRERADDRGQDNRR